MRNTVSHSALGTHYLLECKGGLEMRIESPQALLDALIHCALDAGATVVDSLIHQFSPHGLSGVIVIAESHITIHTWPEYQYSAIDIFTCGEANLAKSIYENIIEAFAPESHSFQRIERGIPPPNL